MERTVSSNTYRPFAASDNFQNRGKRFAFDCQLSLRICEFLPHRKQCWFCLSHSSTMGPIYFWLDFAGEDQGKVDFLCCHRLLLFNGLRISTWVDSLKIIKNPYTVSHLTTLSNSKRIFIVKSLRTYLSFRPVFLF